MGDCERFARLCLLMHRFSSTNDMELRKCLCDLLRAAGWSTMRPDPDGVVRDMTAFLDSSLATPNIGIPETLLVRVYFAQT